MIMVISLIVCFVVNRIAVILLNVENTTTVQHKAIGMKTFLLKQLEAKEHNIVTVK